MERERARYVDVLRNRNFGLLWAGQVVSNFGDRFTYMAVVATIVFNEGGSAMEAGGIFIAWSLPALIFGPIAGVFVDRYNKKRIMILCDILRAGIVFLLPFAYSIIQIYVLMFLVSSVSRFFYPARNAMIPQLVEKGQLLVANSLSQSTYEFSAIAGFAIGGMLVGIMGPNNVFYLDVATYFVSAITIYFIAFVPIGKKLEDAGNALSRIKMELLEGLVYSYREKRVFFILSIFSITMLFFGGINILWLMLIRDVMGLGIEGMGVLESDFGAGMLIGTFMVGLFGYRFKNKLLILSGIFFSSLAFLFIGVAPNIIMVLIFAFISGFFISFINIPCITVLQKVAPSDMLGRVFSVLGTLTETACVMSMAVIGLLAEIIEVQTLIIGISIILLVVSAAAYIYPIDLEVDSEEICETSP